MKKIITLLFVCCCLILQAKPIKTNKTVEVKSMTVKIENAKIFDNAFFIYGTIKQQNKFSYSVSFEDCRLITEDNPKGTPGKLIKWNDQKVTTDIKQISDKKADKFIIAFPIESIPENGSFDIKLGVIQDKNKTDIIVPNLYKKK